MRIRQIGSFDFNADTNIIVDATNQDAPGIGFRVSKLCDPQPFSVEIAFRRTTRQQALDAVSKLARELYSYAQRRQGFPAIAGGAVVFAEDATGGKSMYALLHDGGVTLLGVEATATGVIARVRVTGILNNPFLVFPVVSTTLFSMRPYERRIITLRGSNDAYLYKSGLLYDEVANMTGLYNALIAVEALESATASSRIRAISPASATSGIELQNWTVGGEMLTRAKFTSAIDGTITYTIPDSVTSAPYDVYRLFIEIFCPTTPSANARYTISWDGQPQIAETISGDRSWYTPALFVRNTIVATQLTLNIQNVPTNTLVMPLVLIPTDGAAVWNVITQPTLRKFEVADPNRSPWSPFNTTPPGTIYGPPWFVSSRYVAVFNGVMAPTITSASATLSIFSSQIEPASFA